MCAQKDERTRIITSKDCAEMFVGNILQRMRCIFGTSDYQKWQVL